MHSVIRRHDPVRPRREKMFGEGRCIPLDRNAKARIMVLARALMHRTEPGKHYGKVSAKALEVLKVLLWGFHNAGTGRCFPSYEAIMGKADCARSTVCEAIHRLEDAGILSWCNRLARVREWGPDLFGRAQNRWRVIRTSNQYEMVDPNPSKSDLPPGTEGQVSFPLAGRVLDPENPLHRALGRLKEGIGASPPAPRSGLAG